MVKRKVFAAAMMGIMLIGAAAYAEDGGLQTADTVSDPAYYVSGRDVVISYDGEIAMGYSEDANVIVGVYDNGALVNTAITKVDADTQSYSMEDMTIRLSKEPENASVKLFVWTADGKLTPKATARAAAQIGTVSFKAASVAADDPEIGTDYEENKIIPVYGSGSSAPVKYRLADNTDMYVNGFYAGAVTNKYIEDYILYNENGTVTLVDFDNDNVYDRVCAEYYMTAVAASIQDASDFKRIYFKISDRGTSMRWYDDADVTFVKNGKEISYSDINENDILSIKYDIVNDGSLLDRDFYYVLVSSDTVTGMVTSKDEEKNTISIDGTDYEMGFYYSAEDMDLLSNYTLYLDVFGKVTYFDEWESYKNYGIVVAMYQKADNDYPTVQLITAEGETVAYECKDMYEANSFYNFVTDSYSGFEAGGFTRTDIADRIMSGQTVCTYSLTDGKIELDKSLYAAGGKTLEFKASSCKLGPYQLSDTVTRLVNMEEYAGGDSGRAHVIQISELEDESEYMAYLFDKNSNGVYRFAVILSGTHSLKSEDSFAVVRRIDGKTNINGTDCVQLEIAKDGQDDISVLVEGDSTELAEGSVIAYMIGSKGYVEQGQYYEIFSPASDSYSELLNDTLSYQIFSDRLKNVTDMDIDKYNDAKTPVYDQATSKEVAVYFGIVYKKSGNSLELITLQDNGISDTVKTKSFLISGANSYVYDYGQKAKYRVSVGSQTQSATIFNQSYTDWDKNYISWDAVVENDAAPAMAVVKVVDGDVLDIIYYVAP